MTHTLHRMGSRGSLGGDFILLFMPSKDINHFGAPPKLQQAIRICLKHGAIKIGDCRLGNQYFQGGIEKMLENIQDRSVVHAVFSDAEKVAAALTELKEADLGMSVVVSGLFERVRECCMKAGLAPHTVNDSAGRWGRTERLPSEEILSVNTMCGHGMVTVKLIEDTLAKVVRGELTAQRGAERLFEPCMCGIFNTDRAALLLTAMAEAAKAAQPAC